MIIKGIQDECLNDYKKIAMYIAFPKCSFKCDKLNQCQVCQNSHLATAKDIDIEKEAIIRRYLENPLTEAIILSGLEPFDSILDLISFVACVRNDFKCNDDIVIYTGYTEEELQEGLFGGQTSPSKALADLYKFICSFPNIIIKFGRFIMNDISHYDEVLGINLASQNQYARKVSIDGNNKEES